MTNLEIIENLKKEYKNLEKEKNDLNRLNEVLSTSLTISILWVQKTRKMLKKWGLDTKNIDIVLSQWHKHIEEIKRQYVKYI